MILNYDAPNNFINHFSNQCGSPDRFNVTLLRVNQDEVTSWVTRPLYKGLPLIEKIGTCLEID